MEKNPTATTAEKTREVGPGRFISEPIIPVTGTCDTARMAIGEPGLPGQFIWRGRTVTLREVLRSWRETGPCRHGSGEMYVRKHWYKISTVSDGIMTIYFDRHPRGGKTARWWLFTVQKPENP